MKKVRVVFNQKTESFYLNFDKGNGEILEEFAFDSIEDEVCELKFVKQNEKYYLFGATPNSNFYGFSISLEKYNSYKNKFDLFAELEQ